MTKQRTPEEKIALAPPAAHGPAAVITRRASDKLRAGSLWVYRSDVSQLIPALATAAPEPGSLVSVLDNRGIPVGTALYSSASQITLRMVSNTPALPREQYLNDVRQRVAQALTLRRQILATPDPASGASDSPSAQDNACRLLFSEADDLPGIIADRYNDLILLQLLTQGTAQDDVRAALTEVLRTEFKPAAIWERPDPRIRELEQLAPPAADPLFTSNKKTPKAATEFTFNGLRFRYDAASGQKTGAFLDQRLNYVAAAHHAHGRALDICTYQGGFALHLARVCERVTGVDASRAALEVADQNLELNRAKLLNNGDGVDWIEADAFELLREYDATGERFGTIVLDPPAFAKSKNATEGALRGYKEMNLRALKMLEPGGTLVTCSCSHHISLADFTAAIASAAADAGRRVRLMETRGAAPDHPEIVTLPETIYLKCLILQVL
ncbi:MAG TPA: class I SAM-dependent rRNA methyltransferase [Acidobacteriaceae bacterium]|jgi:23S rRNA (cytosine1962-C5)-methyltransferase|nr:class I SAM-dependent rRNA methyltransferase [Acidobacteriaceae bacterium]